MIEISVQVLTNVVDETMERLEEAGFYNIYCSVPIEVTTVKYGYGFYEKGSELTNINIYVESKDGDLELQLKQIRKVVGNEPTITWKDVEESNWQEDFETIDLGNGWQLVTPEKSYGVALEEKNKIILESQGAFGTGLHETTQDCLRILLSLDCTGMRVLDLGAGSGILSIAAGIKGASSITAVDISHVEREISHNANLNGINNIEVLQQDVTRHGFSVKKSFDLVLINIGGEEMLSALDFIDRNINASGRLLVSGLVEWSCEEVKTCILSKGYEVQETRSTNEWITILFKKVNNIIEK